jgi:hypothetical protein
MNGISITVKKSWCLHALASLLSWQGSILILIELQWWQLFIGYIGEDSGRWRVILHILHENNLSTKDSPTSISMDDIG